MMCRPAERSVFSTMIDKQLESLKGAWPAAQKFRAATPFAPPPSQNLDLPLCSEGLEVHSY